MDGPSQLSNHDDPHRRFYSFFYALIQQISRVTTHQTPSQRIGIEIKIIPRNTGYMGIQTIKRYIFIILGQVMIKEATHSCLVGNNKLKRMTSFETALKHREIQFYTVC